MALRNRELHATNDDDDDYGRCSGVVVILSIASDLEQVAKYCLYRSVQCLY